MDDDKGVAIEYVIWFSPTEQHQVLFEVALAYLNYSSSLFLMKYMKKKKKKKIHFLFHIQGLVLQNNYYYPFFLEVLEELLSLDDYDREMRDPLHKWCFYIYI